MRTFFYALLLGLALASCSKHSDTNADNQGGVVKLYSSGLKDTFSLFVQLPEGYDQHKETFYPVVYLLDANLYFDVMAATFKKYSEVGLLAPAILVGIGYKDFRTMDSLRNRDYTFPAAKDEALSGKGDKFLPFITKEIVPYVDGHYRVNIKNRVLMGHSLGGYFTLYALHDAFVHKTNAFSNYIAASPSLDYEHNYLMYEFEKLSPEQQSPAKVYVTYGGLEDAEEAAEDGAQDSTRLTCQERLAWCTASIKTQPGIHCRGDMYSNLGHMDTQLPTFIRGLQWALNMTE